MSMLEIIYKKRDGGVLSEKEIREFIRGITAGEIPDYQIASLLMAIYFRGLNRQETFWLTDEMRMSGETIDLSAIRGIKVDKHSSGGVGDKTTLIVGPLAAACGVPIAKMSGRGLGFSGGTVDKMEAIPGFRTVMSTEEFADQVNRIGLAVIGQTQNIAAADKILYGIRDVTATVENASLIASSIMSKKLASGSDAIVLDVKCGKGAFLQKVRDAVSLGRLMVDIGKDAGKETVALITNMEQPLGQAVGNSLEVIEVIEVLKGNGPGDIRELSLQLAAYMVYCGKKAENPEQGYALVKEALDSGRGLAKFREFIEAQGGDSRIIDNTHIFPQAEYEKELLAERSGYVTAVDAGQVGRASRESGAGREKKDDVIDPAAGILLRKKTGDKVEKGEVLAEVHSSRQRSQNAVQELKKAFSIGPDKPGEAPLIYRIIMK